MTDTAQPTERSRKERGKPSHIPAMIVKGRREEDVQPAPESHFERCRRREGDSHISTLFDGGMPLWHPRESQSIRERKIPPLSFFYCSIIMTVSQQLSIAASAPAS